MKFIEERKYILILLSLLASLFGCGTAGVPSDEFSDGAIGVLKGSIVSSTGSQQDMFGFKLVLIERDTGICRFSEIDSGGLYAFTNVKADAPHSLILLDATFKLESVLSLSGKVDQTIRQYFTPQASFLPRLIHDNDIIRFEQESRLAITNDSAADADNDGIPTGLDSDEGGGISLALNNNLRLVTSGPDTDSDGKPNVSDIDLDGDGLINWFDIDMDNNSPIDIFDPDADDDLDLDDSVKDTTRKNEYNEGVEFFAVTVEQGPNESSVTETRLLLRTKLRDAVKDVFIEAPNSLISGARYDARTDETEEETDTATDTETSTSTSSSPTGEEVGYVGWDKKLRDDGYSEDVNANDGVYGEAVILKSGKRPLSYQTIFLKLDYGGGNAKYYPYVFPSVTLGTFSISYDANGFRFQKSSASRPFGSTFTNYKWLVKVFNDAGQVVWQSDVEDATTSIIVDSSGKLAQQIELANDGDPDQGIEPTSLKAVGFAISLAKVPGYPAYNVKSAPVTVNP